MWRVVSAFWPPTLIRNRHTRRQLRLGEDLAGGSDSRDGRSEVHGLLGLDDVLVFMLAFGGRGGDTAVTVIQTFRFVKMKHTPAEPRGAR